MAYLRGLYSPRYTTRRGKGAGDLATRELLRSRGSQEQQPQATAQLWQRLLRMMTLLLTAAACCK